MNCSFLLHSSATTTCEQLLFSVLARPFRYNDRMGRPPAAKNSKGQPELTSTWPKLAVSVRPSVRALVQALAMLEGRPAWQVVEDALRQYAERLPPEDRKIAEALVRRNNAKLNP